MVSITKMMAIMMMTRMEPDGSKRTVNTANRNSMTQVSNLNVATLKSTASDENEDENDKPLVENYAAANSFSTTSSGASAAIVSNPIIAYDETSTASNSLSFSSSFAGQIRSDEPQLYEIPNSLYPTYRPIPAIASALVILSSIIVSAITTWKGQRLTWISPMMALISSNWKVRKFIRFLMKAFIMLAISRTAIQDLFLSPSRVSVSSLLENYVLPSKLSRYETVTVPSLSSSSSSKQQQQQQQLKHHKMGVHFIKYQAPSQQSKPPRFEAIYFNHGFGASSLSWLPAMPKLVTKMNAKVGLGHDAVGFGFTDRPSSSKRIDNKKEIDDNLLMYSSTASSKIGMQLLQNELMKQAEENKNDESNMILDTSTLDENNSSKTFPTLSSNATTKTTFKSNNKTADHNSNMLNTDTAAVDASKNSHSSPKSVALFGHSMGAIATLKMALQLPHDTHKFIVLVAPALGISPTSSSNKGLNKRGRNTSSATTTNIEKVISKVVGRIKFVLAYINFIFQRFAFEPIFCFILKKLVGRPNFWKNGLKLAWGNPNTVTDSDALRFQWPSIGKGWEYGLVQFAKAQQRQWSSCISSSSVVDDDDNNTSNDYCLLMNYDDDTLFQKILQLPNTTINIICGSKDRVVSPTRVRQFIEKQKCDNIVRIVEMPGLGHDPFEEDTEGFLRTMDELL